MNYDAKLEQLCQEIRSREYGAHRGWQVRGVSRRVYPAGTYTSERYFIVNELMATDPTVVHITIAKPGEKVPNYFNVYQVWGVKEIEPFAVTPGFVLTITGKLTVTFSLLTVDMVATEPEDLTFKLVEAGP